MIRLTSTFLISISILQYNALAANISWDGASDSAWGTGANWSPDGVPSQSDDVTIASSTGLAGGTMLNVDVIAPFRTLTVSTVPLNFGFTGIGVLDLYGDVIFTSDFSATTAAAFSASSDHLKIRSRGNHTIVNQSSSALIYEGSSENNQVRFTGQTGTTESLYFSGSGDHRLLEHLSVAGDLETLGTAVDFSGTVQLNGSADSINPNEFRIVGGTLEIAVDNQLGNATKLVLADTAGAVDAMLNASGITEVAGILATEDSGGTIKVDASTNLVFSDFENTAGIINLTGWVEGSSSIAFTAFDAGSYSGTVAQGEAFLALTIDGNPAYMFQVPDVNNDSNPDWAVRLAFPFTSVFSFTEDNQLSDSTPIFLSAGTLNLAGFTDTVADLYMEASSTIDVTNGGSISFAQSSSNTWSGVLSISGTLEPKSVRFGTDSAGLTPTQLAAISFSNGGSAVLDSEGYLEIAINAPSDLSGAFTWLDAQDASTITLATGVSQWQNKIGGSNNAVQADTSKQPMYDATGINSLPAIEFDGSNDVLAFQSDFRASDGEFHVFLVAYGPDPGTKRFQRLVDSVDWEVNRPAIYGADPLAFAPVILSTYNSTNNNSGLFNLKTIESVLIGTNLNNGTLAPGPNTYEGFIGEVILYDRVLSLLERAAVRDYLNSRWGIAASDPTYSVGETPSLRQLANANNIVLTAGMKDFYNVDYEAEYLQLAETQFNGWVANNDFKMNVWATRPNSTDFDFSRADQHVTEALARGMEFRGHTLVWHSGVPNWMSDNSQPDGLDADFDEPLEILDAMYYHIDGMLARYVGDVKVWDVVNEPFDVNGNLRQAPSDTRPLGTGGRTPWRLIDNRVTGDDYDGEYIGLAFIRARAADPSARLILNEFGTEIVNAKSDGLYAFVQLLQSKGVPIDGVGFQMHVESFELDYASMLTNFQRFSDLGLEIHITEMDVSIPEFASQELLDVQASIYRNVLETALQVENFRSITMWGITDRIENTNNSPGYGESFPIDANFNFKPAMEEMRQALIESMNSDLDRDGVHRGWEVLTGTNPFDASSASPLQSRVMNVAGADYLAVEIPVDPNAVIDVIISGTNDLTDPNSWQDLDTGDGGDAIATEESDILTVRQNNAIGSGSDFSFLRGETAPSE